MGRTRSRGPVGKKGGQLKKEVPEGEYKVERIVSKAIQQGATMYLIQWEGFGEEERTWEPASNLHKDLVAEFEKQHAEGKVKLELEEEATPNQRPRRQTKTSGRPAPAAEPSDEEEEDEAADPADEDSDFDEEQTTAGRKKGRGRLANTSARGKRGGGANVSSSAAKKQKKTGGKKTAAVEDSSDEDESENDSDEEAAANGDGKENSPAAKGGRVKSAAGKKLTVESPMVFAEGAYLLREADFKMKKTDRPYLKDGIPIWRVDNRHLIQLYQRANPEDFKRYLRTDLYDSWLCNDATGFHVLKVSNLQKTYGRDAEVTVELDDLWLDRIKLYDESGPVEFESEWAAGDATNGDALPAGVANEEEVQGELVEDDEDEVEDADVGGTEADVAADIVSCDEQVGSGSDNPA